MKKTNKELLELFDSLVRVEEDDQYRTSVHIGDNFHVDTGVWYDDCTVDCPEDLIWSRNISDLAFEFFRLGYEAAKEE